MAKKPTITPPTTLLMAEEYWANTHLSVVRYHGCVKFDGADYIIVDKHGRDLWECSIIANREGRSKAIEPGEPADLIWKDLQPHYRTLGRDRILALLKDGADFDTIAQAAQQKLEAEKESRVADALRRKAMADAVAEKPIDFPD